PDDYQAWNNRGYVLHRLERYQDAIVSYTHAIRCNPDCAPAWHNHGYALYHLGRYEAAIDSYDKALNINPAYPEAWHNRGNALNALGQYRDAIGSYDRAIALKPEFTEACKHRDLAQACLQRETDVLPQTYTPLSMRDTLPERQVNTLDSWFNQGNSLVYLGRYEEAIATYNKVLTHCPHSEQQSNQVAQQVYRLATVYAQAMELFGQSTDMAWDWLKRPNTHLQGESPLSLLQTDEGAAQVEGILRTMERNLQRP
ncbi:MAG TPA: tetratricopeptide repeat protein, partial [Stenomitos sp.]